jgi:uncharacterized membrane protein
MANIAQLNTTRHTRFWEIDLLRTNAIVVMIVFHTLYLLGYFSIHYTDLRYLYWLWFAGGGGTFIFLAGVSLTIAHSRSRKNSPFLRRGLQIFAWGMGITLVTWIISRTDFVRFGVLHFFGIAFILGSFFLRFRFVNLILGVALMVIGFYLQGVHFDFPWLLWLGLRPYSSLGFDYIPLLPWFGLFLAGMFFGKILYPNGNRRFNIPDFNYSVTSVLTFPGRHPLIIYLAQWPAIIGILLILHPSNVLPYFPPLPF